jgi:hypothetical protein
MEHSPPVERLLYLHSGAVQVDQQDPNSKCLTWENLHSELGQKCHVPKGRGFQPWIRSEHAQSSLLIAFNVR